MTPTADRIDRRRASLADGVDLAEVVGQVSDYAIVALDPHGTIRSWNAGAERLKGYTSGQAIGRHFAMFYTRPDRQAGLPEQLLTQAAADSRVQHAGWRVRRDGTRFWADVVINAVHDGAGELTGYAEVVRDRSDEHELQEALRRSEDRFKFLVNQVVDYAIIALDPRGTIESWNAGAERLKGYTAEQAIGRHFSMFYTDADRRAGLPHVLLRQAAAEGRVQHTGWRVRRDGSQFWGDVVITALHNDAGTLTGYAKVVRDRSTEKTLQEAQDSFYETFQHDFWSPIFVLRMSLDELKAVTGGDAASSLERAEASLERLDAMARDMLEFANLREPAAPLHPRELGLAQLCRNAVATAGPIAGAGRVDIRVNPRVSIYADESALTRVVANLVGNAMKYSPDHRPIVITSTSTADAVRLTIRDRGRGIHEADLERIFMAFERGRLAQDDGGTGLGLASVKSIVEQHHGRVWISSTPGASTAVTVELPKLTATRPEG